MAIKFTDLKLPEFTYEMHLCLMGTKPSHVSQNFFKFSILPGVLGRSVFKTRPCPVVAILATSSQFTVLDCPQSESEEEARGTSYQVLHF